MSRQARMKAAAGIADPVEVRRRQWASELPDVDTTGMAVLGRARWITVRVRPPIESVFAKHGIDSGEFDVLATLLRSGSPYRMRPTELFQSLMISSGGLTNRLARLESAGLVTRPPSEGDSRSVPVELTAAGRRRAEAAFRDDMRVESGLLEGLAAGERDQLARLLAKLAAALADAQAGPE